MTKAPLVSIVIVNWNGSAVLKDCLESLKKITYSHFEIIIVDNGSTDDSLSLIESYKKNFNLILLTNSKNLGFAPANNQGAHVAKGKYVLLLNNDTKVSANFLTVLVDKMETDPTIGVLQPKIFMMDRPQYLDNAGTFLTKTGFLQHWGYGQKDSDEFAQERLIFSAKGACLLTRRSVIQKVGLFDEKFGSYFEESDFCWRVWLSGWKVVYFPKTNVFHKVGYTSKQMSQIDVNYHSLKNRIRSLAVNLSFVHILSVLTFHIALLTGLAIYYLIHGEVKKCMMIVKAVIWNAVHCVGTVKRRMTVQKMRKISDHELFSQVMVPTSVSEMRKHFMKVEKNFK